MAKDAATKQRFIELRAQGMSYDRIAKEINVSKPTLISWTKEFGDQINEAVYINYESILENYESILEQFGFIEDKLDMLRSQNEELIEKINGRGKHWEPWREIAHSVLTEQRLAEQAIQADQGD